MAAKHCRSACLLFISFIQNLSLIHFEILRMEDTQTDEFIQNSCMLLLIDKAKVTRTVQRDIRGQENERRPFKLLTEGIYFVGMHQFTASKKNAFALHR